MEDKFKILLIDDEPIVLESCAQILEGGNYEIATAANGTLGLGLVQEFKPDLVFVDLKMPGISGLEVLERIRATDSTIVTIVITGFATVSSAVDAMKRGAFDFLPKPFTPDELRLITRRGLENRRLVVETITLRREKEMLREQFAAIVSHELKAPLGALQQNLFALSVELSAQLSGEQKNRLERCQGRVGDLLKLIQTWLRVISTDIDKIKDNFKPIDVQAVIVQAVENMQPHADRKDVTLAITVTEPLPQINGDAITLGESLVNLLGNAIKFSRNGSQVDIRAKEKSRQIEIAVIDRGVGISKEDLPAIFGDFYVGKGGRDAGGSGLGLAITRRIIEAHGGTITAQSELGQGSTFVIRLPIL